MSVVRKLVLKLRQIIKFDIWTFMRNNLKQMHVIHAGILKAKLIMTPFDKGKKQILHAWPFMSFE